MTNQEQQIALCEWAGWLRMNRMGKEVYYDPEGGHVFPNELPDTNSLDVLQEFERKIPNKQAVIEYLRWLCRIAGKEDEIHNNFVACTFATAAQRREALLRVLSLWTGP